VASILKDRASPLNRCLRSAQEVQEHAARLKSSSPLAPLAASSVPSPASLSASPAANPGGGGLVHAARKGGRKLRGAENALDDDGAQRGRPLTETAKRRAAKEVINVGRRRRPSHGGGCLCTGF